MKILAFDLDGTAFLPYTSEISERLKSAVSEAEKKGCFIIPSTGRLTSFIPESVFTLPGIKYIISSNGAGVYSYPENKVVYEDLISTPSALKIMGVLREFGLYFEVYTKGEAIAEKSLFDGAMERFNIPKEKLIYLKKSYNLIDVSYEEYLNEKNIKPEKINLLHVDDKIYKQVWNKIEDMGYAIITSIPNNMEINQRGCSKGKALSFLADKLGVNQKDVMAAGDGGNDISMLQYAGISVAMGNAIPEAKTAAKYVTDTNENDGLAKAIEKYLL